MRFALFLFAAAAWCAPPPFTSSDLWKWRAVSDARISPDGSAVVYVVGWSDPMKDAMHGNLWTVATAGGAPRQITRGPYSDSSPRWSPDGARIAYITDRGGKKQVRIHTLASGEEAEITALDDAPANLAWSPDGRSIAFTARVPAKPAWSIKMPEKPAGAVWAPPPIVATRLQWREDAKGYVPPGNVHLFVVPAAGGLPRQLSSGEFDHAGEPAWMPDGRSILISADRSGNAEYSLEGNEIWSFDVAGGAAKQLTRRAGPDENPLPSPDGRLIAFTGNDYKLQSYFIRKLYVMNADGSRVRTLSGLHDRDVTRPQWSNDSRTLYFLSDDRGGTQVYAARLDATVRQVTQGVHRFGAYAPPPAWSLADNGRAATVSTGASSSSPLGATPSAASKRTPRSTSGSSSRHGRKLLGSGQ